MIQRLVIISILFVSLSLSAEPYITIEKFWYEDQVQESGINGFKVNIKLKRDIPSDIRARLYIGLSKHGNFLLEKRAFIKSDVVTIFFPYYMIDLKKGIHDLTIELDPRYLPDDSDMEIYMTYIGNDSYNFDVNLPEVYKLQLKIDSLKVVEPVDWENKGLPDLVFSLFYTTNKFKGYQVYESNVISDSLGASWTNFSSTLYVSENDIFSVYIEDADNEFDKEISKFVFTYKSFIDQAHKEFLARKDGIDFIRFSYVLKN